VDFIKSISSDRVDVLAKYPNTNNQFQRKTISKAIQSISKFLHLLNFSNLRSKMKQVLNIIASLLLVMSNNNHANAQRKFLDYKNASIKALENNIK
jgi:hypothetical protein